VALLAAVTMTPGSTACVESVTVPVIVELVSCANAVPPNRHDTNKYRNSFFIFVFPPGSKDADVLQWFQDLGGPLHSDVSSFLAVGSITSPVTGCVNSG